MQQTQKSIFENAWTDMHDVHTNDGKFYSSHEHVTHRKRMNEEEKKKCTAQHTQCAINERERIKEPCKIYPFANW